MPSLMGRLAILRSSVLSTALIVGLLATHPKTTFEALATRGDWFLGGSRSETAERHAGVHTRSRSSVTACGVLAIESAF
jgi:hypothetical protein